MPTIAGPNGSTISISFPGEGNSAERAADGAAVPQHRNPMALPGAAELGIAIGSGGTEGVLPAERAKATFDVEAMTNILDGGRAYTTNRRWIFGAHEGADVFVHAEMNRADLIAHGMGHFMDVHAKHLANECEGFLRRQLPKEVSLVFFWFFVFGFSFRGMFFQRKLFQPSFVVFVVVVIPPLGLDVSLYLVSFRIL